MSLDCVITLCTPIPRSHSCTGDYSRLKDLARLTIQCITLRDALAVLRLLSSLKGFTVIIVKDRLRLTFDASSTGGYRDILLNLHCLATGHIFEAQIAIARLLAIKAGGRHPSCQVARLHGLFDREEVYRFEGALDSAVVARVRSGVVRELVCRGETGLAQHFDQLLTALRAPACGLHELVLSQCDWPEGRTLSELVDALPSGKLKKIAISGMHVGGLLPEALFDKCAAAELMCLHQMALTGVVPARVGGCAQLKVLHLWGNELEGPIPDDIGLCSAMESLELHKNKLTGGVPASLKRCTKLKSLSLGFNQLEGNVPTSQLVKLRAMEQMELHNNKGLTITASGEQELRRAMPNAKLWLTQDVVTTPRG